MSYFHLVFSVPHALVPLIWQNKKVLFRLLFEASSATLLEVAADPKHLGAQAGCLSILHTWGQTLQPNPAADCPPITPVGFRREPTQNNGGQYPPLGLGPLIIPLLSTIPVAESSR